MWDALPEELRALVLAHRAALTLQRAALRWLRYGHARRAGWPRVRAHLARVGAWPALAPYAFARREWRREAASGSRSTPTARARSSPRPPRTGCGARRARTGRARGPTRESAAATNVATESRNDDQNDAPFFWPRPCPPSHAAAATPPVVTAR